MINTRHILGLAVTVLLLFAAGCSVDINEGGDDGDDGPGTSECPTAQLATVRFFHGAGGTPVTRPEFGPSTTRNLTVVRPDVLDEIPGSDPPATAPRAVTSLVAGRASLVQLCSNKPLMFGARLQGASADRVTMMITLTADPDPAKFEARTTIVMAGIADTLKSGVPENPASVANPLQFIIVQDAFTTGPVTEIQAVHASRKTPILVDAEVDPDRAGVDLTAIMRYSASTVTATRGTPDTAPSAVPVVFSEAGAARASFSIAPRMPTSAKGLAILFDTEVFDPANPDPAGRSPAPVTRLFLTGNDPLLGKVAGGGVTF